MKPVNFDIEIGELVLHDFAQVDGAEVGASLRAELRSLVSRNGWPDGQVEAAAFPELAGGSFDLAATSDARSIGRNLAHQIYQGVTRATGDTAAAASARSRTPAPKTTDRGIAT